MQKTLIIYAHPNKEGFCGKVLSEFLKSLKEGDVDLDLIDLYDMSYDPVLKNNEHYTSGGYDISQENKRFQEMITEAKNIVFIYPTWWQNMPAILKGFIDRVFTSRFGFEYRGSVPVGLLKGKRAVVFTSSGGPRFYGRCFARDRAIKVLTKDVLSFCGVKVKSFAIGSARELSDKKNKEIEKKVHKAITFLQ